MSKPENDLQITIRMPSTLKKRVDDYSKNNGITSMEFIRRAVLEKLQREQITLDETNTEYITKEHFKDYLIETLQTDKELQKQLRTLFQ